jgi:hypothetical protein
VLTFGVSYAGGVLAFSRPDGKFIHSGKKIETTPPGVCWRPVLSGLGRHTNNYEGSDFTWSLHTHFSHHAQERWVGGEYQVDGKTLFTQIEEKFRRYSMPDPVTARVAALVAFATPVFPVAGRLCHAWFVADLGPAMDAAALLYERLSFNAIVVGDIDVRQTAEFLRYTRRTIIFHCPSEIDRKMASFLLSSAAPGRKLSYYTDEPRLYEGRNPCSAHVGVDCLGPRIVLSPNPLTNELLKTCTLQLFMRSGGRVEPLFDEDVGAELEELRDQLHIFALEEAANIHATWREVVSRRDDADDTEMGAAALLFAIAEHLDAAPGPDLGVRDALVKIIHDPRRSSFQDDQPAQEAKTLASLVALYVEQRAPERDDRYAADALLDFINDSRLLPPISEPEQLTPRLTKAGICINSKTIDVDRGPRWSRSGELVLRTQCRGYRLDFKQMERLARRKVSPRKAETPLPEHAEPKGNVDRLLDEVDGRCD